MRFGKELRKRARVRHSGVGVHYDEIESQQKSQ
ncbi:hypothetical protein T07_4498 [Trichinella nelsoni]|uniref:Uncharacterized protein n=3 Tax=Trichinella TaxID=6333 RepID=A0A0V1CSV9_TRIBR|nr:hypothetical protein T07_4498 [Trichinella nelsoni]KRX80769.1 hypothetical protein T06_6952 [Trichinella sp. T6]KRY15095.1 hypothetical protein T12_1598 [Trichinella patagoniensis]KRY52194.1 hypothetical protein T03_2574 [Trichinella britovi]